MLLKWKRLVARTFIWLVTEISLTILGLDNLADYGEFILIGMYLDLSVDKKTAIADCRLIILVSHQENND